MKELKEDVIWTIEDLYNWACENGCKDFTLFESDGYGNDGNIFRSEINIDQESKTVTI